MVWATANLRFLSWPPYFFNSCYDLGKFSFSHLGTDALKLPGQFWHLIFSLHFPHIPNPNAINNGECHNLVNSSPSSGGFA